MKDLLRLTYYPPHTHTFTRAHTYLHEREVEVEALDQSHERIGLRQRERESERERERVMRASVRGIVQGQTACSRGWRHSLAQTGSRRERDRENESE